MASDLCRRPSHAAYYQLPTADFLSSIRPHGLFKGNGKGLRPLAADQEARAVGHVQPESAVAPRAQHALAVAAASHTPEAIVGDGTVTDDLEAVDVAERDVVPVGGDPAEPDANVGWRDFRGHPEHADNEHRWHRETHQQHDRK